MVAERQWARWAILLPLAALTLLLPMQPASADGKKECTSRPSRDQFRNFKLGLEPWMVALAESDAEDREPLLEKAERRMLLAAKGPGEFPEAWLSLGLVRYTRNHILEAEPAFERVVEMAEGAMRSEALTYLGLISLRSRRWELAKEHFERAMDEGVEDTTTSANRRQEEGFREALIERLGRLDCVARVGSVLATFHMARDPRTKPVTPADFQAVLSELRRLLPADEMAKCAAAFNGTDAAIWRWPQPPVDWRHNLLDGPPDGVRVIPLLEFEQAMRIWASAELAFQPPLPVPSQEGLTEQERHNIAAGLLKRAVQLMAEGRFAEALPVWEQLAAFPQTRLASRQQRIWILLQRPAGQNAPPRASIDRARALIRGEGAAEDPLLFEEQLYLATTLMYSATDPDPARRRAAYEEALQEFRVILDGFPGIQRQAPEYVRRIAEWNIAVLLTFLPETIDPAYWERGLQEFPALPGRERIRLLMAFKLAESYLAANNRQGVMRTMQLAERIVSGQEGPGSLPIPNGQEQLRLFRRYMAKLVFQRNLQNEYQDLLRMSDFAGQYYAWEAAEAFRRFVEGLLRDPRSIVNSPVLWDAIIRHLETALQFAGQNQPLRQQLERDLAAAREYRMRIGQVPLAAYYEWNVAARMTNSAQTAEQWEAAAAKWREVLGLLQGGSPQDRARAAQHVVNGYLKKADVLHTAMNTDGARAALEQARDALGVGPMGVGAHIPAHEQEMIKRRIENNLASLAGPVEKLIPELANRIVAYRGPDIRPCGTPCMIVHYPEPHQPDVADLLERLQRNEPAGNNDRGSLDRLVDWFNTSPMRRGDPTVKRDWTPETLLAFLSRNLGRGPDGVALPRTAVSGIKQWCDMDRKLGEGWHSYDIRTNSAAFYLKNGLKILNVECANPLDVIRVEYIPAPEWQECVEEAELKEFPQFPAIVYGMPEAEFSSFIEGIFQPYALPLPTVTPVPILPPAISVLAVPEPLPKLAIPGWDDDC